MQVPHPALLRFATDRLTASGMCPEFAKTVAETLLEGDRLGHGTHGLALLPRYLSFLIYHRLNKCYGVPLVGALGCERERVAFVDLYRNRSDCIVTSATDSEPPQRPV